MSRNTLLPLIEQLSLLLVFAVAAALCLRSFFWSGSHSRQSQARDQAVIAAQSAAERLKAAHGDLCSALAPLGGHQEEEEWAIYYNADWQPVSQPAFFYLTVESQASGQLGLGSALVQVWDGSGSPLVSLPISWPEVL